ncbi:MAG: HD domain-containing protein [Candidatus Dojkabacteria bacterium]
MPSPEESEKLLLEYIQNESLLNHCRMVAKAMGAYAKSLNLSENEVEEWYTAGLLHDLDWEKFPDEHPNKAVNEILPAKGYPENVILAVKAHGPQRTGKYPETKIEKYLFACDELSGFLNASSLMRPTKFEGMEVKSVKKKLKDKHFAANVSREDIEEGARLIERPIEEHIQFLINVFNN